MPTISSLTLKSLTSPHLHLPFKDFLSDIKKLHPKLNKLQPENLPQLRQFLNPYLSKQYATNPELSELQGWLASPYPTTNPEFIINIQPLHTSTLQRTHLAEVIQDKVLNFSLEALEAATNPTRDPSAIEYARQDPLTLQNTIRRKTRKNPTTSYMGERFLEPSHNIWEIPTRETLEGIVFLAEGETLHEYFHMFRLYANTPWKEIDYFRSTLLPRAILNSKEVRAYLQSLGKPKLAKEFLTQILDENLSSSTRKPIWQHFCLKTKFVKHPARSRDLKYFEESIDSWLFFYLWVLHGCPKAANNILKLQRISKEIWPTGYDWNHRHKLLALVMPIALARTSPEDVENYRDMRDNPDSEIDGYALMNKYRSTLL